jgi:hypothetical protein
VRLSRPLPDDEPKPRARREWTGTGSLRRDAHHITATHGDHGVIWSRETSSTTRVRLKLVDGFLDLREEVLDGGTWKWSFRGLQFDPLLARQLIDALESACT